MKITQFRIHGLLLLACAMLSLVACNPPEPEPEPEPAAKVTVSGGQSVTALPQGGDLTISFTANKQWSISVNKVLDGVLDQLRSQFGLCRRLCGNSQHDSQ